MNLFHPEGKLYNIMCKATDCVCLSLIWFIMSLPIVTLGASTAALYYATEKVIRKDFGSILGTFWKAFKDNFKQSTFVFIMMAVLLLLLGTNMYFVQNVLADKSGARIIEVFIICTFILVTMWAGYLLYYISKFSGSIRAIMKNTFFICLANPFWSIILMIISVFALIIVFCIPVAILFLPVVYALVRARIFGMIFKKYLGN